MSKHIISIAIDGPSGAGKSTLAKSLASTLKFLYVDTGAIYRTIGLYAFQSKIQPEEKQAVIAFLPQLSVQILYGEDGLQHMILNGQDVTKEIRLPEISMYASVVSAYPEVRHYLLEMQREFARKNNVIMDGRDIGTVVLPDADVKIFLTASPEARAHRRCLELQQRGTAEAYEKVLKDILQRDRQDSSRATAPLKQAEDAVLLDTTELSFEESKAELLGIIKEKTGI